MGRLSKAKKRAKTSSLISATTNLIDELGAWNLRLHISNNAELRYRTPKERIKRAAASIQKPWGLWYGFDGSWMEWSASEFACMLRPFIYEIIFKDESRILKIGDIREFEIFEREYWNKEAWRKRYNLPDNYDLPYGLSECGMFGGIDWKAVMQKYVACEINPYLWEKRLKSIWYYGWDCASGCVWDKTAIEFRLFARYDKDKKVFVRSY